MVCYEFKGGIGTASRRAGDWTVGVAGPGQLRRAGIAAHRRPAGGGGDPRHRGPWPWDRPPYPRGDARGGSIIRIVATDAPLLPHQCERLAQRATIGMARVGSFGSNNSGPLRRLRHREPRAVRTGAVRTIPRPTVDLRHGGRRPRQPAARGGGGGDRGVGRQRPRRRRDHDRPGRDHRPTPSTTTAWSGSCAPTAAREHTRADFGRPRRPNRRWSDLLRPHGAPYPHSVGRGSSPGLYSRRNDTEREPASVCEQRALGVRRRRGGFGRRGGHRRSRLRSCRGGCVAGGPP